ncbi:hypothetical protein ACMU_07390 [Actibacterium mucosum KCTC 23349]|uniref:5-bromo-4-chloroindolyl phosphate hydrolysis protein n=1 Tax=Actibacterium mucosum KCTC 23349 TaxID=1454373 RepID=A0A037ZKX8_9RHOB|nr:5-bromo-4-chloroindolyl phosphate hydrolysis family protein [Actibacterium mucosum]KAJ56753.1 hypothetical protein ACMU_07390 [Actibacterium mucosum KCTC 23349]
MKLPDGPRQILAGVLAAVVFLALYFGISLVWWAALGLGIIVYFALLLVVGRRTPADEVMLSSRVSAADVKSAGTALQDAANRLAGVAETAPQTDRAALVEMADHLRSIRENVLADPQDFRSARRFVNNYLPVVVQTVEAYGALARRAGPKHGDRLQALGTQIRSFGPVIEEIDRACLENDFAALEVQVAALATQMDRG